MTREPLREFVRLSKACIVVSEILDEGKRDPTWAESQELEEAALQFGRAMRRKEAK